jgi:mono/diheme cytochrome c family protein
MFRISLVFVTSLVTTLAMAPQVANSQQAEVSVAVGERISIIGGCHDCHSVGYNESGGKIDPAVALKGSPVGFQGPWGTNYPANLRITAAKMNEDDWVKYLKTLEVGPPMPWFNVRHFTEAEMRSLHQYILSLGEPGDPAPKDVPPGGTPKTPYMVFAPPTMPAS